MKRVVAIVDDDPGVRRALARLVRSLGCEPVGEAIIGQREVIERLPIGLLAKATHWFASNHALKSQDTSDGFTRRWLFPEFKRKVPEHRKVTDIAKDIIANEREAIAAWAVQAVPGLRGTAA